MKGTFTSIVNFKSLFSCIKRQQILPNEQDVNNTFQQIWLILMNIQDLLRTSMALNKTKPNGCW